MHQRFLTPLAALCIGLPATVASASDGAIDFLSAFGTSERPLVAASSARGVVLIGPGATLFRGFASDRSRLPSDQPHLWMMDIDQDGAVEIVGAGNPSFVIETNGDPQWGVEGCLQFFVGDFIDDRSIEVLCRQQRGIRIWSYDGQEYYQWEGGRGFNVTGCFADDFNSNGRQELVCGLSNGRHLHFDFDFAEPEEKDGPPPEAPNVGVDRSSAMGAVSGTPLRLAGGSSVSVAFAGGAIVLSDGSGAQIATVPVSAPSIHSAIAADLDNDGTSELYVGGVDEVYVLSPTGTLLGTVPANPTRFRRDARVTVRSATANGLVDSERDTIRAVVDGGLDALATCYSGRMGRDTFTRVGQMVYELTVDGRGRVTQSAKRHSGLRNSDLERCVEQAFGRLSFPNASSGTGTVGITLDFDFVDVQ
jgi:hypothetical protein